MKRISTDLPLSSLRVALVHDWLTGMRGGEKVLEVFCELFPDAPIYTLVHIPGSVSESIEAHRICTSPLQRIPFARRNYRYFFPFFPTLAQRTRIAPVDLVLSVSSCIAKGIVPPPGARHASYVLTPMRYLYDRYRDYFAPGRASLPTRLAMRMVRKPIQAWDRRSIERVDSLASISTFVAQRIETVYGRATRLIHPPVDVDRFGGSRGGPEDYYLIVSALVPYKNVDVAIDAFRRLDRRLVIVGQGPLYRRLRESAPPNVEVRGWVDDAQLPDLVARCRAFIFPNVEDFGIAPVEAMAAGRPVIALGQGGALDTVCDLDRWQQGRFSGPLGPSGILYQRNDADGLAEAVRRFERQCSAFSPDSAKAWARRFDHVQFRKGIVDWLADVVAGRYEPPADPLAPDALPLSRYSSAA